MRSADREPEYVELEDCYISAVTAKAIQVHHDGDVVWVPKSLIEDPEQFERWDTGVTVMVEEWFARKEELI
jgi:hypothetical protein